MICIILLNLYVIISFNTNYRIIKILKISASTVTGKVITVLMILVDAISTFVHIVREADTSQL